MLPRPGIALPPPVAVAGGLAVLAALAIGSAADCVGLRVMAAVDPEDRTQSNHPIPPDTTH
jgi:hypothetical protein